MNLRILSDQQILDDLRELVSQEREMLSIIVQYIAELDDRKLHVDRGFPSAYMFCVTTLGYSEAEAVARIRAARLIRDVPVAMDALEDGRLSLSVASRVQTCLQREKGLPAEAREELVRELFGRKIVEAERILAARFPQAPPRERKVPISDVLTKLEFVIPEYTRERMEKILSLRSHKNPAKRLDVMLDDLLDLGLKHWDPADPRKKSRARIAAHP